MPGHFVSLNWPHDPTLYAPAKYKKACRYDAFIPDSLAGMTFSLEAKLAGLVSEAEAGIYTLNHAAQPALAPLARLLLRTESIASSKVEGMTVGVRELARAEAKLETGGKLGPTALEVLGNIDAMALAVDEAAATERFSTDHIIAIHRRLMERAPNAGIAGRIRTRQNWIGGNDYNPYGADFVPPPPEYVSSLLTDLCEAINDDVLPPLVQAALVHAQFETIHPFDDGNGRTGRALIHVVLRRRHVAPAYVPPISVVLANARDRYIDGLTRFRTDHVAEWIEHFAGAAAQAAHLARTYLQAVQDLVEHWRQQLGGASAPRGGAVAWDIIDALPAYPLITGPAALAATGRSRGATYTALQELVDAGVLRVASDSKRGKLWEAVGLLDLLAGLEAGVPLAPGDVVNR